MELSLAQNAAIDRVSNAVAAGTTAVNSSPVDMQGFESVAFITAFGTISSGAVTSTQIEHSADGTTWNPVEGSKVTVPDTASNKVAINEAVRPTLRYIRLTVNRGTANAVIDGIVAVRTRARKSPTTQGTTIVGTTVVIGTNTGTP